MRAAWTGIGAALGLMLVSFALPEPCSAQDVPEPPIPDEGCNFQKSRSEFLDLQMRVRREVFDRVQNIRPHAATADAASQIVRRNFIDEDIFSHLDAAGVAPAALTTDEEFLRRIYLDLTGRVPS